MYEDRFTRAGGIFAGVCFVLAYCVLLFDPVARSQTWPWLISTGACVGILIRDERRLPPERLALAYPASRTMHVLAFGPIAVMMHFMRTRWPLGISRAFGAAALAGLVVTLPEIVLSLFSNAEETLEDLPVTLVVLAVAPIVLAPIWRALEALQRLFDLELALVIVGNVLVFGSAVGIGIVLHR